MSAPAPPPAQPEVDFEALERRAQESDTFEATGMNPETGTTWTETIRRYLSVTPFTMRALLRLARLGAGKGPAAGQPEEDDVIHWAKVPFRPFCGANNANQHTTDNARLANCRACFAAVFADAPPLDQAARAAAPTASPAPPDSAARIKELEEARPEMAERICAYGETCLTYGFRHGPCLPCEARRALSTTKGAP